MAAVSTLRWLLVCCMAAITCTAAAPASPPQPPEAFTVLTSNEPQARIAGVLIRASGRSKGTVIACHGIGDKKETLLPYRWIAEREGWNLVLFDFRGHGESTRSLTQLPTLGYHEIWDVKAVVDWAEQQKLARPYAIWGVSMGASIGLRWAAQDRRIVGVLAQSPYRNAWDAVQQFQLHGVPLGPIGPLLLHGGLEAMLREVDLPKAVSRRDDLLLWITVGSRDWFPVSDEQEILDASPAPAGLKRLEVAEGFGQGETWVWKRNDPLICEFLAAVGRRDGSGRPRIRAAAIGV